MKLHLSVTDNTACVTRLLKEQHRILLGTEANPEALSLDTGLGIGTIRTCPVLGHISLAPHPKRALIPCCLPKAIGGAALRYSGRPGVGHTWDSIPRSCAIWGFTPCQGEADGNTH